MEAAYDAGVDASGDAAAAALSALKNIKAMAEFSGTLVLTDSLPSVGFYIPKGLTPAVEVSAKMQMGPWGQGMTFLEPLKVNISLAFESPPRETSTDQEGAEEPEIAAIGWVSTPVPDLSDEPVLNAYATVRPTDRPTGGSEQQ